MDEVLERELKWDVAEDFALPSLDDIVAEADVERSTVTLSSAYYDTVDGDLQTHGVLLRRRDGDDDTGWQLEVPDAEGRVEIRTGLADTPPSELTDALTGMRLGKPLVNVATIRTTRDRYRITDPRRRRLCAEVADDHVLASIDHRLLAWREIEVELGPAARSLPRRLTKRLTEAGATPSRYPSKLARISRAASTRTGGRNRRRPGHDELLDGADRQHLRRRPRVAPRQRPHSRHAGGDPTAAQHLAGVRQAAEPVGERRRRRRTQVVSPGCSARSAIVRCNAAASRRRWRSCRPSSCSGRSPTGSTPICSPTSCRPAHASRRR